MKIRLALSGSGFLAGIHAGAICAFRDSGVEIVELACTSGGSIVGIAAALGYPNSELEQLAVNEDMSNLLDKSAIRLAMFGAFDSGETIYKWLDTVFGFRTLKDCRIPISVIATDIATGPFVFSNAAYPDVPCALAARASAAVPKVWDLVQYQDRWLADGGMCANIPVDYLKRDGVPLFGIKVTEKDVYDVSTRLARDEAMISRLIESNEDTEMALAASIGATIIKVDAGDAGFLDCKLPTSTRQGLFNAGYSAVMQALKG